MEEIDSTEILAILAFQLEKQATMQTYTFCIYKPDTMEAKPDYGVIFKKSQFCGRQGMQKIAFLFRIGQGYKARGNKQPWGCQNDYFAEGSL